MKQYIQHTKVASAKVAFDTVRKSMKVQRELCVFLCASFLSTARPKEPCSLEHKTQEWCCVFVGSCQPCLRCQVMLRIRSQLSKGLTLQVRFLQHQTLHTGLLCLPASCEAVGNGIDRSSIFAVRKEEGHKPYHRVKLLHVSGGNFDHMHQPCHEPS